MTVYIRIVFYVLVCCLNAWNLLSQDLRIRQRDLPFAIPILVNPTQDDSIVYQWIENEQVIDGANDYIYIIPFDKAVGTYTYIHQVQCEDSELWLSSNSFTVEIYEEEIDQRLLATRPIRVKFSPQLELKGYLDDLIALIDNAKQQLDISIYSLDNYDVYLALSKAVKRGVQVRMLYEGALKDRNQKFGTASHRIEEMGVDVKYVNKTNHHKFVIADRELLMSSSGNWNAKTNWKHQESSLLITDTNLLLQYRAEFELLWNHSREFGNSFVYTKIDPDSLLAKLTLQPDAKAYFTSSNYKISHSSKHGPTFSKSGNRQLLADQLVLRIEQAEKSIKIASNYLRSRPICEALIAKKIEYPNIEISVITDQNEYITANTHQYQVADREACYQEADTPAKKRDCLEKNFMYSYNLLDSGIEVRFKCYSYKWHYSTARTMHHKYAIFDDEIVAVGSYNYSYNSETNCMENLMIFNKDAAPIAVEQYVENFNEIWELGRMANYYQDLLTYINSSSRYLPLLFMPISLEHAEYAHLKRQIELASPRVKDEYFKNHGHLYTSYLKGVSLKYGQDHNRLTQLKDDLDGLFSIDYDYDKKGNLLSSNLVTDDGSQLLKNFQYDNQGNLIKYQDATVHLDLTYDNKQLKKITTARGSYYWETKALTDNEQQISYHATDSSNDLVSTWTNFGFPKSLKDGEKRSVQWEFNDNRELSAMRSAVRNLDYETTDQGISVGATDGNQYDFRAYSLNKYAITSTGAVASTVHDQTQMTTDENLTRTLNIYSTNVSSGIGRMAHINYVLDPYARVIEALDIKITRKPFTGEISSIRKGNLEETRTYSPWRLLTEQLVTLGDKELYKAQYHYDALSRIIRLDETVAGDTNQVEYTYNSRGELHQVVKNGQVYEQYTYDGFGNRIEAKLASTFHSYTNNDYNQTLAYSWMQSGLAKHKKFKYNWAGQLQSQTNYSNNSITATRHYDYDLFGNLTAVLWASQQRTYQYDVFNRPVVTYHNSAAKQKLVFGIDDVPIAALNENDRIVSTYLYKDTNSPLLMRKGSRDYYLLTDIRGSLRMVIQLDDGQVIQEISYDAFGKVLSDTRPGFTPFGFTGGLYDHRTGLLRLGIRDYYAEIGKWTTENPLGFLSGHFNAYTYANNDPINYTVPNGMQTQFIASTTESVKTPWNSLFNNALGAGGKGMSWIDLESLLLKNAMYFEGQTVRNMNNKIYPMTGHSIMHDKIDALKGSKYNYTTPNTIQRWAQ